MKAWSDEQKADAIVVAAEYGLTEGWRRTGVPKPTLARWLRAAGIGTDHVPKTREATIAAAARADQLRAELRTRLLEQALDLLDRMDAEHVDFKGRDVTEVVFPIAPAGAVQNYATSVGILIDKYRLEVGEATTRSESRDITGNLTDDELDDAIREAEEALRGADPAAEG
jgi:transposase-like protein